MTQWTTIPARIELISRCVALPLGNTCIASHTQESVATHRQAQHSHCSPARRLDPQRDFISGAFEGPLLFLNVSTRELSPLPVASLMKNESRWRPTPTPPTPPKLRCFVLGFHSCTRYIIVSPRITDMMNHVLCRPLQGFYFTYLSKLYK